jgi:hypothetical protein
MSHRNTLQKGDWVLHKPTGRKGQVQMNPRSNSLKIAVILEGRTSQSYLFVGDLRFLDPETRQPVEDIPPVNGDLPPAPAEPPAPALAPDTPRDHTLDGFQHALHVVIQAAVRNDPELFDACAASLLAAKNRQELQVAIRISVAVLDLTRT